jgi:hypothetical protein
MNFKYLYLFIIITISGCYIFGPNKPIICDCCEQTFTSIDSARKCITNNPYITSSSDPRLFLLAFVRKDVTQNQKLGWDIINDQEIISIAKRNYLLITLDLNNFLIPKNLDTNELNKYIKQNKSDLFFIISNQDIVPFSDWTLNDKKSVIIERLGVGNGP